MHRATPEDEAPKDVPALDIPITGDDGTVKKVPFARATVALRTRGEREVLVVEVPWEAAAAGLCAVAKTVPAR